MHSLTRTHSHAHHHQTLNITGSDSGATLCIEYATGSAYIGGSYPTGVKGTADWTQVTGKVDIPTEATHVSVDVYVRKNMVGEAWFDQVSFVRVLPVGVVNSVA
jgi:hypothetical protein